MLQSSPQNPFTSRYALEVLDLWSRYFEPNALSWESHWAWLCPEGLKCGDIGYFFLDDRDPHRQEVIFQALGTANRSEWRFDPEVQEERRFALTSFCHTSTHQLRIAGAPSRGSVMNRRPAHLQHKICAFFSRISHLFPQDME